VVSLNNARIHGELKRSGLNMHRFARVARNCDRVSLSVPVFLNRHLSPRPVYGKKVRPQNSEIENYKLARYDFAKYNQVSEVNVRAS
jgi:hypothetical protein